MSSWRVELEKLLRDQMPYAFMRVEHDGSSKRPAIGEEAFTEALGYIMEFVFVEKKNAYILGYQKGAALAVEEIQKIQPEANVEFSEADSRIGAEREFHKSED